MPRYGRSVRFWVWEHFSNVPSDVVGRIFQNLIGPEERHRYGQHFTGDGGVDLINTFCIRSGRGAVLDPAWPTARPFRRAFHPPRSGYGYGSTGGFSAKCTKLKREPQAVCCPPPDGDEVSVGTRQRECSDQVIARDFLGKAGQPSQLSLCENRCRH